MYHRFPHRFTPEQRLPAWQRLRVESLPFRSAVLNTFSYFRKSIYKKHSAPPEELHHFEVQRNIFRHLMKQSPSSAPTRLALLGDLMWIRDGWDSFLDRRVLDHLNSHDVVIGNLESVISPRFRVPSLLPDYLTYNSHPNLIRSFRRPNGRSTFSALSLSNNHALDRGEAGARDTQDLLGELGIPHSGVSFLKDQRPYTTFEVNGIRFGFYAAAWGLNSFVPPNPNVHMNALPPGVFDSALDSPVELPQLRRVLSDMAADGCDFRIVALHWGYEFEYYPCPGVMRVGHEVVRAGADVVLGTHPHVQQPCETLFVNGYESRLPEPVRGLAEHSSLVGEGPPRKALVAYSLGNFTTTMFTFACKVGWVLSLRVGRGSDGRIDWVPQESAFVVNAPRFGRERERLLLLESDYRKKSEEYRGLPIAESRHLDFLQDHVFGTSRSAD
jgi:poly-gamma-glutamate synthesis protein (capsule biosynthesis protein)